MLLQEQSSETTSAPIGAVGGAPPTTQELAKAIVSAENHQNGVSVSYANATTLSQTVEHFGLDIDPDELLTYVQEQRVKANQERVMTKHRALDRTAWAFLGGMIGASAIAVFLMYTNFVAAVRVRELKDAVGHYQYQEAQLQGRKVSPQTLVQAWSIPGAQSHASSTSGTMATSNLTVLQSYASVWKYYAQETGYTKMMERLQSPTRRFGGQILPGERVPQGSANWSATENGELVMYKMESRDNDGHPLTFITRNAGPNIVTILLMPGATKTTSDIMIYAMNSG